MSDSRGEALDFSLGRTLGTNYGIIASGRWVHSQVIDGVQQVVGESEGHSRLKRKESVSMSVESEESATTTFRAESVRDVESITTTLT